MERWPRISIVTPSFNQGHYIAATIDSVLAQEYPNFEHIIMDGGSTDSTLDILRRYPHLRVISEPDRGQADAINKGFRLATGTIWGFLNSDDTLLPGTLHRVAQEIDPARERHVVMGRCRFIDEHGRYTGIEHFSQFVSHRRVLEIWKGHGIPQPAVFWTPEVWRECGGMDESLKYHLDYDLFCRFSQKYRFHWVDQLFATYRLHAESKTEQWAEADRLADSIQLSRRYWGSPLSPTYWRLALSLAWHQFKRTGRALPLLLQAQDDWGQQRRLRAIPYAVAGIALAPEVAFYLFVYPFLRAHAQGLIKRVLDRLEDSRTAYPQTAVYSDYTDRWPDGWAGPRLLVSCAATGDERQVGIQGWVDLTYMRKPLVLTLRVDGQPVGEKHLYQSGAFTWRALLSVCPTPGQHTVEVRASNRFVLHRFTRDGDFRPLAWQVENIAFQTATEPCTEVNHLAEGVQLSQHYGGSPPQGLAKSVWNRLTKMRGAYPQTVRYCDYTDRWPDGWVGPRLLVSCAATGEERQVGIQGWADLTHMRKPLVLTLCVDGQPVSVHRLRQSGAFTWRALLSVCPTPGQHTVEVRASNWFVPHRFTRSGDFRPLAWRAENIAFQTE